MRAQLSLKCLILGHEDWVRHAPGRIYLECSDCGRETPGWTTARTLGEPAAGAGVHRPAGRREELQPAA